VRVRHLHAEQAAALVEFLFPIAVPQEAVITNALETAGQDVKQETPDEFIGGQGHRFDLASSPVILPLEADLIAFYIEQAIVGDGHAMGIAADIVENLLRPGERALGIDHPLGSFRPGQMPDKREAFTKWLQCAEKLQSAGIERVLQGFEKQASEQTGQNPDWQEEVRSAGNPSLTVG
jgi:hypothetical protein